MPVFNLSELPQFERYLADGLHAAAKRGLLSTAMRVVSKITTEVIPAEIRPPVDRGIYRAAWRFISIPDGAMVVNTLPYASIIEYGARAENIKIGRAMIDALTEWVQRKGLVSRNAGGVTSENANARAMAWAIAQKMKKNGIFNRGHGLRILEKALRGIDKLVEEEITREVKREFA